MPRDTANTKPADLSALAATLQGLAADAQAIAALRQLIDGLRASENAPAQQAGTCWAAALGAVIALRDADDPTVPLLHAVELLLRGVDAWAEAVGDGVASTSRRSLDPISIQVFDELAELCRATRETLRGSEEAGATISRRVEQLKRSTRAMQVGVEVAS